MVILRHPTQIGIGSEIGHEAKTGFLCLAGTKRVPFGFHIKQDVEALQEAFRMRTFYMLRNICETDTNKPARRTGGSERGEINEWRT
jgi:hypothetical protein